MRRGLRYERAARAYGGYWLVEARRAELAAARGQGAEAMALYTRVAGQTPSPEVAQALGELYAYLGRPAEAAPWYQRALAAYTRSVERGEVHYLHALAAFDSDVSGDATAALRWAEADSPRCGRAWRRFAISWPGRCSAPAASTTPGARALPRWRWARPTRTRSTMRR